MKLLKPSPIRILNIGIEGNLSIEEAQRVRLTNLVALLPLVAYIFYVVYGFIYQQWFSTTLASTMIGLTGLSLALNSVKKYGAAKLVLFFLNGTSIWITYHVFNVDYAALSAYFPIIFCFAFFFDFKKEKSYLIIAVGFITLCIASSFIVPRQILYSINLEEEVRRSSNLYHIIISFLLTGLVVYLVLKNQIRTTKKIQKAKEEAERYTRLQTEFLANVSHEIRTPLNGIIGITELLKTSKTEEETNQYLKTIRASGHLLTSIINDVLDVSKLEAHKIRLQKSPFRFESSLTNCVNITRTAIPTDAVALTFTIDPKIPKHVSGDRNRLEQVLSNLLNNAIKFTHEGHISLEATLEGSDDKHVKILFKIEDTGIGISAKQQNLLFNRFYQANSSKNRLYKGTGLGLAICKNLVNLMGGDIWVESTEGEGSTFYFNAYFNKINGEVPNEAIANIKDWSAIKVLVAEDNTINKMVIYKMLKQLNVVPQIASNGHEAIEAVTNDSFDLILMDVQMPGKDGIEATEDIRQLGGNISQPKIIALTANASSEDILKCKSAGMDDYLPKPLLIKELNLIFNKYFKA